MAREHGRQQRSETKDDWMEFFPEKNEKRIVETDLRKSPSRPKWAVSSFE